MTDLNLASRPVRFLDLPLTIGKQWQSRTTVDDGYGTFDTMAVQLIVLDGPWFMRQWTYNLLQQLGPVIDEGGDLVAWTGVVPTDESTWGEAKAL